VVAAGGGRIVPRDGLIDRIIGYVVSVLIGGMSSLGGPGASSIDKAWRWHLDEVTRIGP
jgi:hypothetical protein